MSNPPPTAERTQLRKSLKLWQIVMIGLAYLTPMTVFDTFGIVSGISQGHVPTAYLLALAGVLFTAISYGKLVRQFPTAGSAYTYAQRAINPHVGFMVGWSSLLDYLFLPMINALLAKIYLTALFPEVAPWIWVVMFVLIMTLINIKSVNLVANFNTVFVLVQLAIIVVFIGLVIHGLNNGEGTATVLSTRRPGGLHLRQSLGDRAFLCARRAQPQPQGAFPLPGPAIARRGHRRGALAQPGKHLAGDGADLGRTGLRLPVLPDSQLQPSAAALPGERAEPDPVRRAVNGFSGNVKEKDW